MSRINRTCARKLLAAFFGATVLIANHGFAAISAISGADLDAIYGNRPWPDLEDNFCGVDGSSAIADSGGIPSSTLETFNNSIKPRIDALQSDYKTAADQLNIPWQFIAAIHYKEAENDPNRSLAAGELLGSDNPDGFGVLPSDRVENYVYVMSQITLPLADHVYGIMLGTNNPLEDYAFAMLAHNRGGAYRNVPEDYDGPWSYMMTPYVYNGMTEDTVVQAYPENGYWPHYATNPDPFNATWGDTAWGEVPPFRGLEVRGIGALTVYLLLGGPYSGTQIVSVNVNCIGSASGGGTGYITSEGYAFPLAVTKSHLAQYWNVNCQAPYPPQLPMVWGSPCHHHYYAADIFEAPNEAVVVAASSGTVVEYGRGSDRDVAFCDLNDKYRVPKVRIMGNDGYSYYYTHMAPGSLTKAIGEHVEAGDALGIIGPKECAEDTTPHLHFDIRLINEQNPFGWQAYYFEAGVTSTDGVTGYTAAWYVNVMPLLQEWHKALPE